MTGNSRYTSNALCDTRLFGDNEIFDISSFRNMSTAEVSIVLLINWLYARSTAKFDACPAPFRICDVLGDLLDIEFEGHHTHRIWIRLTEDGAKSRNLLRYFEVELFAEDLDVLLDPVDAK